MVPRHRSFAAASRVALVSCALLFFAAAATAAPDITVGGIPGGSVTRVVRDPNAPATVYAAVSGNGFYKSTDDGATWSESFLPLVAEHEPADLLASAHIPGVVLACENNGTSGDVLSFSSNGGATFAGKLYNSDGFACYSLAEGAATGTFFAAGFSGNNDHALYKSTDGGRNWNQAGPVPAGTGIFQMLPLPSGRLMMLTGPKNVAGGLGQGGPTLYSDDDGATFSAATGLAGSVMALAWNGTNRLIAASDLGGNTAFFSSTDDGATWSQYQSVAGYGLDNMSNVGLFPLAYHSASDTFFMLFAPTSMHGNVLLQSSDGSSGYTWSTSQNLLAGLMSPVNYLLGGSPHTFAVNPSSPARIIAGGRGVSVAGRAGGNGIFVTTNGGASWAISNAGIYSQSISFAAKDKASGFRYASNAGGVYFSGSGGLGSWTTLYQTSGGVGAFAFDDTNPARVLASIHRPGCSGDDLLQIADATAAAADVPPYAHAEWTALPVPTGLPILSLLVDGSSLFAGVAAAAAQTTGQYLFQSTNGGTSWSATSLSVPGGVGSLAFDPTNHQILYAGVSDFSCGPLGAPHPEGLYGSTDGGGTWSPLGAAEFGSAFPRTIVVDPANPQRLWIDAHGSGGAGSGGTSTIWESIDRGARWTDITPTNLPTGGNTGIFLTALAYSSSAGTLFLGVNKPGDNIYGQIPGTGSSLWYPAFGVYGGVTSLYSGSLGVGTGTGLFEASHVSLGADPTPGHGKRGCGCDLSPASAGEIAALVPMALLAFTFLARRRRS